MKLDHVVVLESWAVLTAALVGVGVVVLIVALVEAVVVVLVLAQVELVQVELEAWLLYLPQP